MSITRLQQARQMYALGQRVRFQGGGMDAGAGSGFGDGPSSSDGDKSGDRHNPHTDSGYSKSSTPTSSPTSSDGPTNIHVDNPKAPPAYEIIGGKKYDVTPDTRQQRELARMKQTILDAPLPNFTKKGTEYYDPNTGILLGFAPTKQKFGLFKDVIVPLGLTAINPALAAKYSKAKFAYNTAKNLANIAQTIGLTDKNVVDSFTSNFSDKFSGFGKGKSKGTTSTNNTNTNNGGEGLASLENQASGYDEYVLLLQKLQSGNISDSERNRFNVLKNMLGI